MWVEKRARHVKDLRRLSWFRVGVIVSKVARILKCLGKPKAMLMEANSSSP